MANIVVDIADGRVSADPDDTIVTYSLGSCIGVAIWDPETHVGGMLHYMLPLSKIDKAKAEKNPWMFGDTGIPELFRKAYRLGAEKSRLVVKLAGGANILDKNGTFNIGTRNHLVARKVFWKNNILVDAEDVGGMTSRTLRLDLATGRVSIRQSTREEYEL
jgi:chemotaxis protein CheD